MATAIYASRMHPKLWQRMIDVMLLLTLLTTWPAVAILIIAKAISAGIALNIAEPISISIIPATYLVNSWAIRWNRNRRHRPLLVHRSKPGSH